MFKRRYELSGGTFGYFTVSLPLFFTDHQSGVSSFKNSISRVVAHIYASKDESSESRGSYARRLVSRFISGSY